MINEKYLSRAYNIRKDYKKTYGELEGLKNEVFLIKKRMEDNLNELKKIRDNTESYDSDKKYKADIMEVLYDLETQTKKADELYSPLNEKMETLKKQEQDLYDEIKEKYPKLSDEYIIEQVNEYFTKKQIN
jgi:DNA repair exonuclease SbcCD nuclease subunit